MNRAIRARYYRRIALVENVAVPAGAALFLVLFVAGVMP